MKKLDQLYDYCKRGWPIFPLEVGGKKPITSNGYKDASIDKEKIRVWHEQFPGANWGLATGSISGILVVDIDQKNDGLAYWEILEDEHPELIETPTCLTGGGGIHLYFAHPAGADIRNSAGRIGKGIDVRANGGYVVIPPSKTQKDYIYQVDLDTPLAPLPAWIRERLDNKKPSRAVVTDIVSQGERHSSLVEIGGALRNVGLDREIIKSALLALRDTSFEQGDHPVTNREVMEVVEFVSGKPRGFKRTDLGNAERFVSQHGEKLKYCYDFGCWLVWDGKRWNKNLPAEVERMAFTTARNIYVEAANTSDENTRKNLGKWAMASESKWRIGAMIELAQPFKTVGGDMLDRQPFLLNCNNGIVDLSTGDLKPHDKKYLLTKLVDVDYNPAAECPSWTNHLDLVTGGDRELQFYLQKMIGYCLTGCTDEHALFFLFGAGMNGKSVTVEALLNLLGEYGQRTNIEALLSSWGRGSSASPEVAQLAGVRLAVASEVPDNRKLNESLIKDITGGDRVTARLLHKNPFTFKPSHKLMMIGNYKPRVGGDDLGFWRRMHVIPFDVTIPIEKRRRMSHVLDDFENEKSGILTWAIEGCLYWMNSGLELASAVVEATDEYRTEEDILQRFLDEFCEMHPDYSVLKRDLFLRFKSFCENEGEASAARKSQTWLTRRMTKRGFESGGEGNWSLIGIRIRPVSVP